ncbi:MAG: hypothetical protein Q7U48_06255 [Hydrogenophaga sp.]|nr:hypothetical protein [Hydrogenophaga sp.]
MVQCLAAGMQDGAGLQIDPIQIGLEMLPFGAGKGGKQLVLVEP